MRKIKLTKSEYAIVDDEDFEKVSRIKWHFTHGYARTDRGNKKVYMHRLVMKFPSGMIDHINQDKLDNRKCNLRISSKRENAINSKIRIDSSTGIRGVAWQSQISRWRAYIQENGRQSHLGVFKNIRDAIKARKQAERILWEK